MRLECGDAQGHGDGERGAGPQIRDRRIGWMNAAIGISAKDPESAQNAATGPTFLLLFASNAIVPTSTLPGWLQPFARDQPLGVTTSAVRELFQGGGAATDA